MYAYIKYIFIYGAYYFGMALFSALISVFLMAKGLTAAQVSLAVSAACLFSMTLQPLIGILQDRGNGKLITAGLLAAASVTGIFFSMQSKAAGLILVYGITVALLGAANPYIEKIATIGEFPYRSIRIWGTFGYGLGAQVGGILYERFSGTAYYLLFALVLLVSAVGVLGTRRLTISTAKKTERSAEYKKEVLGNHVLWKYIVIAAIFYASANLNSTYLPAYYQQSGLSVTGTSTVLFVGTLMELPVIFFASYYMNRLSNRQLLSAVFGILILQFAAYALVSAIPVWVAATVLFKSVATMAYIMLNIRVVSAIVSPAYQMSALTLVASLSQNLMNLIMQNVGGAVFDALSGRGLFTVLLVMAVIGFVLIQLFGIPTRGEDGIQF